MLNNVVVPIRTIFSLIAYSIALKVLVSAVHDLARVDADRLIPAVSSISVLLLILSKSAKSLKGVKVPLSAMTSLGVFVAGIYVLTKSIEDIAKLDIGRLVAAMASIVTLISSLVVATHAIKNVNVSPGGILSLIAFSSGVYMLAQSVKTIADLDVWQLTKGMIAVGGLMAAVVAASYVVNNMSYNMGSMIQMITLTSAIRVLVESVKVIADIPIANLITAVGSVSTLLLALSVSVSIINANKAGLLTAIVNIWTIQTFTETISQIGKTLVMMADIPWDKTIIATGALAVVLGMLVALMAMSDNINGDVGELATLALVLYTASTSIARIAEHDWSSIVAAAGSMVFTLTSVAATILELS